MIKLFKATLLVLFMLVSKAAAQNLKIDYDRFKDETRVSTVVSDGY